MFPQERKKGTNPSSSNNYQALHFGWSSRDLGRGRNLPKVPSLTLIGVIKGPKNRKRKEMEIVEVVEEPEEEEHEQLGMEQFLGAG